MKGILDAALSQPVELETLAGILNRSLCEGPLNLPISFAVLQWDLTKISIQYLSCGYGSLWIVRNSEVQIVTSPNMALGIAVDTYFKTHTLEIKKGDLIVLCPLSNTNQPFSPQQFHYLLHELRHLPPQQIADTIYRKAQSSQLRYLEEHPFTVIVLKF